MNPHEVVMRIAERDGRFQVRQFLAESVRQAGKTGDIPS
jgi:hypothetical protein